VTPHQPAPGIQRAHLRQRGATLGHCRQSKDAGGGPGGGASSGPQGPGQALSGEQKVVLWEELTSAAFTRAVGSLWLLPLLDLFVRVQLNILGRHLYLESALDSRCAGRWLAG
jgi:hypothetical protein